MPTRRSLPSLLPLALAAALACSTVRVKSETYPQADFRAYHTYAWKSAPAAPARPNDWRVPGTVATADTRIRAAVDRELRAKGYQSAGTGAPDFLVDYDVSVRERNTETFREWGEYRAAGGTQGLLGAWADGYEEGTLVLAAFDGRTGKLAWRSWATAVLRSGQTGAQIDEAVDGMVSKLPSAPAAR